MYARFMSAVSTDECDRMLDMLDEMGRPNDHGCPGPIGHPDRIQSGSQALDVTQADLEATERMPSMNVSGDQPGFAEKLHPT